MEKSNNRLKKCRFCNEVSRSQGQDPIGSLIPFDSWLIIELKQPWKYKIWIEPNPVPQEVIDLFQEIYHEKKLRTLAIAPDQEYSIPNCTRVLNYSRPAQLFAEYEKKEYLIPSELLGELAIALYQKPQLLDQFEQYRQETNYIREIMVCTHGNVDAACARFGYPIYQKLRQDYARQNLRIWRCSHFGGHQFAPTLIDMPAGRSWGHLEPQILGNLINQIGDVTELRSFYRGSFGLTPFEQIAEREIWMRQGWDWYHYHKWGQVLEVNEDKTRAVVQITFANPNRHIQGNYQATIEQTHIVESQHNTKDSQLTPVPQYHVSGLKQVS